jgi:hypothetical protein
MMFWDWNWGAGLWASLWIVFVLAVLVTPWVFFLMALRGVLEKVSPQNRAMAPEHVWLNLIPVFNLGWFIYTVAKVRDSAKAEYYSRGWPVEGDFGYNVGLAAGIVGICAVVLSWVPVIDFGLGVAALVCLIVYWVKMADLKNRLSFGDQWRGTVSLPPYAGYQWPYDRPPGPGAAPYAPPASYYPPAPQPGPPPAPRPAQQPAGGQQPGAGGPGAGPATAAQPGSLAPKRTQRTQCAVCGTTVAPDDRFCRGCGLPLP